MITAEEWWNGAKETRPCGHGDTIETATLTVSLIKQIQLDAWKQGMTDVAEVCIQYKNFGDLHPPINTRDAILTKRDNTTSL